MCGRKCVYQWRKYNSRFHSKEYKYEYGHRPEVIKRRTAERRKYAIRYWPKNTLRRLYKRAKDRGHECNLDITDLYIPNTCPILGIPIVMGPEYAYNSPSVDRIDNSKGYVKGNIQIISQAANAMKSDMPLDVWISLVEKLKRADLIVKQ